MGGGSLFILCIHHIDIVSHLSKMACYYVLDLNIAVYRIGVVLLALCVKIFIKKMILCVRKLK